MKNSIRIYFLLFSGIASQVVMGQCALTLAASNTNSTCNGCNNGTASVSISGGTAPYTYVWTNSITPGIATILPSKDNSIYEETVTNSNGAGQYLVAGMTNAGFRNRALLSFDITGNIPSGALISNTSLQLTVTHTSGASGPQPHTLYKVLQNWGEGTSVENSQPGRGAPATSNDATWLKNFFPNSDWTIPGGYFNASSGTTAIVNNPDIYTWSSAEMITDVQSWLNSPSLNFGWLLKSDETGNRQAKRYGSRENVITTNRPVLTITYGPAVMGNTSSVSNLAPGTYTVTVTDALSCTATATVNINVTALPVATTYRGAFAPAPTPMWTNNWINWDPNNTYYPNTNITVTGSITGNAVWTKKNTYKVSGVVSVDSLATLTIEAGTIIRGDEQVAGSVLVVRRGAQIFANGTECNPIVFTSNKAQQARAAGDWGGVILLGRGINNLGTQVGIEGIDPVAGIFHGGTVAADNSGSMKYCRIEFSGFNYGTNNEINGLTFGSVGSGTVIDNIEVSIGQDDAFEWFGGGVNCSHLVAFKCQDDDWDTDNGFSGLVQFGLSVRDASLSDQSTSEGFESDNDASGTTNIPKTSARFYNITQIGGFRCAGNAGPVQQPTATLFNRGARLRRNTELKIFNSILLGNWRGLEIDAPTLATGLMVYQNSIIAMDTTTVWTGSYAGVAQIYSTPATAAYANAVALTNSRLGNSCDVLANAWDFLNPDYRPNTVAGSSGAALLGCDLTPGYSIGSPLFIDNESRDFLVNVTETNIGVSNGQVTVRLFVPNGWTVSVPGIATLPVSPAAGTAGTDGTNTVGAYTNSKWTFQRNGASSQVIATLNVGETIPRGATIVLGFVATRKSTTADGTNQNLSTTITGGSDNNAANNSKTLTFGG